jgi:hypothetical protein
MRLAVLEAWFGKTQDLAATRRRLLASARAAGKWEPSSVTVMVCCISPSPEPAERADTLALARELGKAANDPYSLLALGMAEFRSGNDATATEVLERATRPVEGYQLAADIADLYLAMSLFRQGKRDEARVRATGVAARMKPLPADEQNPPLDFSFANDAVLWLAYKEAKALIGFDAPPAPQPGKKE